MITLTVTTLDDEAAGTTVATVEAVDGSGLSLREAVTVGAAYDDASVEIVFAPRLAGGTIELEQGPLAIAPGTASGYDLAIHGDPLGDGAGDITIFGGTQAYSAARIVDVAAGTNLALDDLRIEGAGPAWADGIDYPDVGYLAGIGIAAGAVVEISDAEIVNGWFTQAYGEGGGIHNAGTLTLRDVDITGNGVGWDQAGGVGGGIYNAGTLTMERVEVSGNRASGRGMQQGGGIYNAGSLSATASLVAENGGGEGAGVYNVGDALFVNSTIALNSIRSSVYREGSGVDNGGALALVHSIVAGHYSDRTSVEIENSGTATLTNSIVFESPADGPGVAGGTVHVLGGNIVGTNVYDGEAVTGAANPADIFRQGVALTDNGGPTRTINLDPTYANPAVDAGDASFSLGADGSPLVTDARGLPRDVDIAGLGGGAGRSVDLGPVERAYMAHELVIDGKGYRLRTFGEGGDEGSATVAPGGAGVTLEAGARKEVSTFKLTAGTVLSFDFAATDEGDLHAIGFDTAGPMDPDNVFQLLGTQTWGNQWAAGEASADGAVTHFEIPVGALVDPDLVGEFVDLVFITDDAAMGGADTTFADISLRQASAAEVDLLLC
ncbi:hypothetical protein [Acuticoccus sp. I52.16.1]|uniref:hypothetical protein n=1 Tax=Acuticoccus sp. I52.16.1 TaxID=2928472 RepID=UPI001FD36076|nr:hypothetical protein [Acuticoccus sp. I52.16.1]UOM36245.1 hypothetical protein MRB58_08680 [Acuticoccus sp. I52.16.1]